MRQIVLDTETTGLDPLQGHRVIEIGCVELVSRRPTGRTFHHYLQPDREIDLGAVEVHGITAEFLADKPRFADIVEDLIAFLEGAELIIHNAAFDVGFLNYELKLLDTGWCELTGYCTVVDTLAMARQLHPGQRNSLDALCKRYGIDNSQRDLHGALLDARILADVYLAMTGGQAALLLDAAAEAVAQRATAIRRLDPERPPLRVIRANADERTAHEARLEAIERASGGKCVWRQTEPAQPLEEAEA
jgi:DNA polymerase III subunit epsilon